MKKLVLITLLLISPFLISAQTTIYSQNFGTGTSLPTGWTVTAGSLFEVRDQTTDPPATGTTESFLYAGNTGTAYQEVIVSGVISTVGYTGIQVKWTETIGPDENSNHPGFELQWSLDGISWTNIVNPGNINDYNEWGLQEPPTLPTSAENVSNLRLKFLFTSSDDAGYYALDDFIITGTYSPPVYYNLGGSDITVLTNWGRNVDGTGVHPTSFASSGQTFNLVNGTTATLSSALTIGAGSKLVVGDGNEKHMSFTIPSSFSYGGTVDVTSTGTLNIANTTNNPTIGVLAPSSTVVFNGASAQTVPAATYSNLTINIGSNTALASMAGSVTVDGILSLSSGVLSLGAGNTLTANGTINRTNGSLRSTSTSNFVFNGSTGTIVLLSSIVGQRTFNNFTVSSSGSLTISSGGLIVNGRLSITAGTLVPSSGGLTIATSTGYLTCSGTGVIQGNGTSTPTIIFSTTNSTNSSTLALNQSTSSTRTVNITLSGNHVVNLASNVVIPVYTQSAGTFDVGANYVSFNSAEPILTGGTFVCIPTSTVDYSASPAQNVAALNYGNLTFSSAGQRNLPSGTIGISGTFTPGTNSLGNLANCTFNFNGTGAQTIPSLGASVSYSNIIISGTRTSNNVTLGTLNPINITGTLTLSATFTTGGYITTGSTVVFTGASAQTVPVMNYNNLTLTGVKNTNSITLASGTIGVNGTLTVSPTFTSGGIVSTGNTLNLTGGAQTITITNVPSFIVNNLTLSGAGVKTLSGNLQVGGIFSSGAANDRILSIGNNALVLNGTATGSGLLRSNGASKIRVGSTGDLGTLNFDQTTSGTTNAFKSLMLTGTSTQVTLGNALQITDTVDIAYTGVGTSLTSAGNLTLLSTASKTALLYEAKTGATSVSGNVNVQRYARTSTSTPVTGHYFGSPITNGNTATIANGGTAYVLQYNENTDRVNSSLSGGYRRAGNAVPMQVGRGYSKSWAAPATITFSGTLNNGNITYTCTNTPALYTNSADAGWNMLSNPYPGPIDWSLGTDVNIQGDMAYLFNSSTGSYTTLDHSASGYIETGRGFFVQAATGGGSVTFTNSMRVKSNNNSFSRLAEDPSVRLKLELVDAVAGSDTISDELILTLDSNFTNGFDIQDARKMFGIGKYANFAFLSNRDSLVKQSINAASYDLTLPLYLKVKKSGTYHVKVKEMLNIDDTRDFYIKDATTSSITDKLTPESVYSFNYDILSSSPTRLSLVMKRNVIVTNEADEMVNRANWITFANNGGIVIQNSSWNGVLNSIELLDVSGRSIFKENNVQFDGGRKFIPTSVGTGAYLIRIETGNSVVSKKVFIQ